MERHRRRHQRLIAALRDARGQSTVEYAVIVTGFMALVVCLATLYRALGDGALTQGFVEALTHAIPLGVLDVLAF